MDKDRVEGAAKDIKGKVKQTVGKAAGSGKMQAEGTAERIAGKAQNTYGRAKDAIKE
ncbi:MAG TPA: CsbD family protein [Micavibrio sp.]